MDNIYYKEDDKKDRNKMWGYLIACFLVGAVGVLFFLNGLMTIGGTIAIFVIEVCLLGLALLWFLSNKNWILDPTKVQTGSVSLLTIIYMMVIVVFSLQSGKSLFWVIPYIGFILILLFGYFYIWWKDINQGKFWEWVRQFWNPKKAFGGGAFGDFANTVGVLSAIALGVQNAGEGWFWLGQFGAFLAAIVGLSLVKRWTDEQSTRILWSAGLNFSIASFTFMSITCPTNATREVLSVIYLKISQIFILGLMLFIILYYLWRWLVDWRNKYPTSYVLFFIWILIQLGGAIAQLLVYWVIPTPDWLPYAYSIAAIITWIAIEAYSIFQKENFIDDWDWYKMLKVLRPTRSVIVILGNFSLFALVIMIMVNFSSPGNFKALEWSMFLIGIIFTIMSTVGGILIAARTVALRHAHLHRLKRSASLPLPYRSEPVPERRQRSHSVPNRTSGMENP